MKYRLVIHNNAIEDIRRNSAWWKHHDSREPPLIQKGAQTFLSVVFEHSVLEADKNVYPPLKLFFELLEVPSGSLTRKWVNAFAYEIRNMLLGTGAVTNYRAIFTIQGDAVHVLAVHRTTQDFLNPDDFPSNL